MFDRRFTLPKRHTRRDDWRKLLADHRDISNIRSASFPITNHSCRVFFYIHPRYKSRCIKKLKFYVSVLFQRTIFLPDGDGAGLSIFEFRG